MSNITHIGNRFSNNRQVLESYIFSSEINTNTGTVIPLSQKGLEEYKTGIRQEVAQIHSSLEHVSADVFKKEIRKLLKADPASEFRVLPAFIRSCFKEFQMSFEELLKKFEKVELRSDNLSEYKSNLEQIAGKLYTLFKALPGESLKGDMIEALLLEGNIGLTITSQMSDIQQKDKTVSAESSKSIKSEVEKLTQSGKVSSFSASKAR